MQINWSVVLNVLLLLVVVGAIVRMLTKRRAPVREKRLPSLGNGREITPRDVSQPEDIISIRKVMPGVSSVESERQAMPQAQPVVQRVMPAVELTVATPVASAKAGLAADAPLVLMIFLSAKANRQLAGYELLQTVLATGLRFGEGQLFHRHQSPSGQGPVMCSLAAATEQGVFDLQNIGAFFVRGLCLFMHASGNPTIDAERFDIMLDTARQLGEGLDTHVLDDRRQPLSEASIARYHRQLGLDESMALSEACL